MPSSIQDQGRSMLKLAQFQRCKGKLMDRKYIELILQELDPNLKVSSTDLLGEYGRHLDGDTLVHVAYAGESVDALEILMSKGADYNVKNKKGNTVLHMAFNYFMREHERFKWNIFQNDSYTSDKRSQFITSILSAQVKYSNTENPSDPNGLTHFHIACAINNVEAVEFFLKNEVPVDQTVLKEGFKGYTGLHFASQFGCLRVIEILLEHGANGNLEDAKGRTPLYIAIERNITMIDSADKDYSLEDIEENEQVIQLLIDHDFTDKCSFVHVASSLQSTATLENYLTQDKDVNQCMSMDSPNWPGYTALHFAAHVNVDTVKLLMKYGGSIEAKDANGVTPFDLCVQRYKAKDIVDIICLVPKWKEIVLSDQKTKLIDLLLAFKDSEEIQNFLQKSDESTELFIPFDSPLWPGFTVLHIAVLLSERKKCKSDYEKEESSDFDPDLTVVTEILEQGADVTTKDSRNMTPVHFAFQLARQSVLDLLFQYHYRMQNIVDDENLSHLHIACWAKNENFVARLLRNNVDVNIPYKGKILYESVFPGSTPLHIALYDCERKIARLLLKSGADLHIPDACTFTPVHFSMCECSQELSEKLFSSPNLLNHVVEKVGLSYLHVACFFANLDAIKRLLDLGVDVNQVVTTDKLDEDSVYWRIWDYKSRNGDTPLHTAMRSLECSSDLISLLIERGADILARNAEGKCPLENILEFEYKDCLAVLVALLKRDGDLRRRVVVETGITLLHVACLANDVGLVKELLGGGADVTAQVPEDKKFWAGNSPLHIAYDNLCFSSEDDRLSMMTQVSLLLKAHKNFHVNPIDPEGMSHFHIACHVLDVEVVEKFLENDVDVNAKFDLFYNVEYAGCSPLLLATRTTNWRDNDSVKSLIESSAKLRIVDLLIKHGAKVNVEDIDGNTPAHYAAFCSFKDESYLKLLADNGADVNTRNVKGKTPLELMLRKEVFIFEDFRYFIACGCIFNEFTLDTEEGYIALVNNKIPQGNMESLLEETFTNYPDSMKRDSINRTAIHNLVSTAFEGSDAEEVAALVDILMEFGCDADDQDNLGRTALHLAARFRNYRVAEAMLLVGADFSIIDNSEKPLFAYLFEPCLCDNKSSFHEESVHPEMPDIFRCHVRKMEVSDLDVDDLNKNLYAVAEDRSDPDIMHDILQNFLSEFQQMTQIKIVPYSIHLVDFVSRAKAVLDYPRMSEAERDAIDAFFKQNASEFRNKFPNATEIFQLQYRQAVLRGKMMVEAKDSLSILARFQVPEICSDIILRFLENSELRKLIASTNRIESRSVDTGGDCVVESKKPRF